VAGALVAGALVTTLGEGGAPPGRLKVETTGLLTTLLEEVGLVSGALVCGALATGALVGRTGFVSTSIGPMLMFPAKEGIVFLPPSLSETI